MKTQFRTISKSRISPRLILGLLVALVVFFLLLTSVIGLIEKHVVIKREIATLEMKQADLQEKKEHLIETNQYFQTAEGREHVFRDKYNVVKPGEGMIVITSPTHVAPEPAPTSRVSRFWQSILRGIGFGKE